jgi:DNA-binding phage protein
MKTKHKDFQEYLLHALQDPKTALAYLNEALLDEDQRVFLLALKNVLEAQGGDMSALAREAQLNRENLYRKCPRHGISNSTTQKIIPSLYTYFFQRNI